jgi:rhodanese-related sulfurtransferase
VSVTTTVRRLSLDQGLEHLGEGGGALIDLRPAGPYLESHIPESLALTYEFGPGLPARARDCLPLDLGLILLDPGDIDLSNAAAALRGKGFTVIGAVHDPLGAWSESGREVRSTRVIGGDEVPAGLVLEVGDPGAAPPEGAMSIPIERLYRRAGELDRASSVTLAAGYGVRAALAVGILERHEVNEIVFWRTRG